MPPPPPPPMKYVSKTAKSPPRQPVSPPPVPSSGGGSANRQQQPSPVSANVVPSPMGTRPRSSTVATPEKPNGGGNKSPMGRSRAMSRPAARPPPQFANNSQGSANTTNAVSMDQPTTTRTPSASSSLPQAQPETRTTTHSSNTTSPLPTTHHHEVQPQVQQQYRGAPVSTLPLPTTTHHHHHHQQPPPRSSSPPSASTALSSQHLEYENKELRNEVQKLKGTVETLQRDNNLLQDRLGSLLDCGITPTTSTLESYNQSRQKDTLLQSPSTSMAALAAAAGIGGSISAAVGGGASSISLEHEFMKVRIQRLEAALALEMKARESLEDTCAAQKKVIVHRLAAMQQQQQQH